MIRLAIAARSDRPDVIAAVRVATGESLAEIRRRLASGEPLVEGEPYDDVPERMRAVVVALRSKGVEPAFYLLDDGEALGPSSQITSEAFHNMLRRAEGLAGR
jgi:hypothetical protein